MGSAHPHPQLTAEEEVMRVLAANPLNPLEILGLPATHCTKSVVKQKHKQLMFGLHPDKHRSRCDKGDITLAFIRVQTAHKDLMKVMQHDPPPAPPQLDQLRSTMSQAAAHEQLHMAIPLFQQLNIIRLG